MATKPTESSPKTPEPKKEAPKPVETKKETSKATVPLGEGSETNYLKDKEDSK